MQVRTFSIVGEFILLFIGLFIMVWQLDRLSILWDTPIRNSGALFFSFIGLSITAVGYYRLWTRSGRTGENLAQLALLIVFFFCGVAAIYYTFLKP